MTAETVTKTQRALVLCVDDEPLVLTGIALHLRKHFNVVTAPDGASALQLLSSISPAVIVSDMRMPGMTGAELFKATRAAMPNVSRILLTGGTDLAGARAVVEDGGICQFLLKPCPPKELLAAVTAGIARHVMLESRQARGETAS